MSVPAPKRPPPLTALDAAEHGGQLAPQDPPVAQWRRHRLVLACVVAALLVLVAVTGSAGYLWVSTPSASDLQARVTAIAGRGRLQPSQVPAVLEQAVVAAEDERFYVHHGLDTVGSARAVWDDVTRLCLCEGGSTLTQQLAKLVYYPEDGRLARKLPTVAVAFKIELRYSKAQIMADYLSVMPTGYGLVGAQAGSCAYFGHGLSSLTVAEAAELAGMVQGPSAYDPRLHPDKARVRRDYAVDRMLEVGYITPQQAQIAKAAPLVSAPPGASCHG